MANQYIVNSVTTAELSALVSGNGLKEGLQYKNTETGKKYLALNSNTLSDVPILTESQVLFYAKKITLTNDQIKTLPTTAIELIPAPGEGKAIYAPVVLGLGNVVLKLNWVADYSNISQGSSFKFFFDNLAGGDYSGIGSSDLINFFAWGADSPIWLLGPTDVTGQSTNYNGIIDWENQPLKLKINSNILGNFTGGHENNTLDVIIYYSIIDV